MRYWLLPILLAPLIASGAGVTVPGNNGGGTSGISEVSDPGQVTITCTSGQVLKTSGAGVWACADDSTGSSGASVDYDDAGVTDIANLAHINIAVGDTNSVFSTLGDTLIITPTANWPWADHSLNTLTIGLADPARCPGATFATGIIQNGDAYCRGIDDTDIIAGITRDTEWDTTAEINAATTDDDFVTLTGSEVMTNKTLTTPTIADFTNATHTHQDAAGGGTLNAAAIGAGTLALARGGTGAGSFTASTCVQVASDGLSLVSASGACNVSNALSFTTISTSSGTNPVADSVTDTLTLSGSTGITVTGSSAADSVAFALDSDLVDLSDGTLTGTKVDLADASTTGVVSTSSQTFAGAKTFADGAIAAAGKSFSVTSGASIGTTVDAPAHATNGGCFTLKEGADDGTDTAQFCVPNSGLSSSLSADLDDTGHFQPASLSTAAKFRQQCISIASPSTSTDRILFRSEVAGTITGIDCVTTDGNTPITVQNGGANASGSTTVEATITCTTTNTTEASGIDNAALAAGDWIKLDVVATVTTTGSVALCVTYTPS